MRAQSHCDTYSKTQPPNKPVVFLENIMVSVTNPRKGAQNGYYDENVCNYAANEDSRMLNGSVSNDVDNLVY